MLREAKELGFRAVRVGVVIPAAASSVLRRKEPPAARHDETVDRLIGFLLESQEWDEAFDVIRDASQPEALVTLFELAHEPLLKSGRKATLAEWLSFAGAIEVHAPLLDLVRAELAIREGTFGYAEHSRFESRSKPKSNEWPAEHSRSPGEPRISTVAKERRWLTFAQLESLPMMIANATAPHGEHCLRRKISRVMTSWDSSSTHSSGMAPTALTTRCEQQRRNLRWPYEARSVRRDRTSTRDPPRLP